LYRIVEKLIDENIETFEKLGMTPGRKLVFIVNLCNFELAYLDEGDKNYLIHRLRLQFPAEKRRRKKKEDYFESIIFISKGLLHCFILKT
jgi:hypothetical protein